MSPAEPAPAPAPRRHRSKTALIGLGLLFTLAGLFLVSYLLPVGPGPLATALGVGAAGILCVWIGGILMGRGSRS
jgi:hypothetical protein